jgi:TonB-linked SusC/RagA family outer membrane protein
MVKRFTKLTARMTILLLLVGTGVAHANVNLSQNPNPTTTTVTQAQNSRILIKGVIKDPDGNPLVGVTVVPKAGAASISGVNGEYMINVRNMNEVLTFSYIGMEPQVVELKAGVTEYNVNLDYAAGQRIEAVVVEAGIIQRDKLGFTGSFTQVSGEDLKMSGSINVVQSLKSLDPAFSVMENSLTGSDPNALANVSLRGGSSMNISSTFEDYSVNPNAPLFILDGVETSLQVINDMDINRIESVTILKDAGSTAIYGSRGGNGVIIVETVKPKAGQLRLAYSANLELSAADLSDYNLMNAEEKLRFEVLAGRYGDINDWIGNAEQIANYNSRLQNVQRGVDTYWLKVPLRTGVSQDHSINIDGGEGNMLYQAGVNFKNVQGVMKGSNRESFGGNVRLQYRTTNKLNVVNNLSVSVTNAYRGSFEREGFLSFVRANPYFTMMNDDGTIPKYLDSYTSKETAATTDFANPYYNATRKYSRSDSKTLSVVNNTTFDWWILPKLRWTNQLSLSTTRDNNVTAVDPQDSSFDNALGTKKGTYTSGNSRNWNYDISTRLAYSVSINEAHNLTFNGRAGVVSKDKTSESYTLEGFPEGVPMLPSFASGFKEGSRASYLQVIDRSTNLLVALSYNYKLRYLFDFNLSNDGSTAFGKNNKFQNFWSLGFGWNVSQEPFAKDWKWLDNLKLRGSHGINGNQTISDINNISSNVYNYFPGSDIFGAAAHLSQFANPNLKWQVVTKSSAGIDLTMLKNRLDMTLDVFRTETDPLIVGIDQKPSAGVKKYPVNLGFLRTTGVEFMASYQFYKNVPRGIVMTLRVTGMHTNSKYGGFADALNNLNESYKDETVGDTTTKVNEKLNPNSLVQYRDGGSPTDLWAVRSLGIDPQTGREVFLSRFGTPTYNYSADDRVVIASSNPDLEGIVGLTVRVKNLTANFNFRYSFGGYKYNSQLLTKVENIDNTNIGYNQDRRALYDRWSQPGDVAGFKAISLVTESRDQTPISSRFIQRNNFLSGESARISYSFTKDKKWVQAIGMEFMTLSLSYSDLFYWSTMRRERSTQYPFARTVRLGLSAQF